MKSEFTPEQADRLRQIPVSMRPTYRRALGGRSLRAAVNAFCHECCGWDRGEVARCSAPACPLHGYRPGRKRPVAARGGPSLAAEATIGTRDGSKSTSADDRQNSEPFDREVT